MDDIRNMLLGVDTTNEIFNLWYETTFVRLILNQILVLNPELAKGLTDDVIHACRKDAEKIVQERFPVCKIQFSPPSEDQVERRKQHVESLKKFNQVMGGLVGQPILDQTEDLVCNPQDPLEAETVYHPPSNET